MNDLVLAALASLRAEERPQVVHQAGEKLYEGLRAAYEKAGVGVMSACSRAEKKFHFTVCSSRPSQDRCWRSRSICVRSWVPEIRMSSSAERERRFAQIAP